MGSFNLCISEPYKSPAWGSNFVVFQGSSGLAIEESQGREYMKKAIAYAKNFRVYLVPERMLIQNYNTMCLIDPQGDVVVAQQAIFLDKTKPILSQGDFLNVWQTPYGRVSLCPSVDIYHPEVPHLAYKKGAEVLVSMQHYTPEEYSVGRLLTGSWNASQSNPLMVVEVSNMGHCVCLPRELTKNKDGFAVSPSARLPLNKKYTFEQLETLPPRKMANRRIFMRHRAELTDRAYLQQKKQEQAEQTSELEPAIEPPAIF